MGLILLLLKRCAELYHILAQRESAPAMRFCAAEDVMSPRRPAMPKNSVRKRREGLLA